MTTNNCFECKYLIRNTGKYVISYYCRKKKKDIMYINNLNLFCMYGKIRTIGIMDRIRMKLIRFKEKNVK